MAQWRSPRLTTRVALFFGLIGMIAGLGLTTATYSVARESLLDQRLAAARSTAFDHALEVRTGFDQDAAAETFLGLDIEQGGFAVLTKPAISYLLQHPETSFPLELREAVASGQSGQQQFELDGENYLAVGVHISSFDTSYFEAFPLDATERTLTLLVTALLIGSALAALLATFFGFTTSRGLLRPLTRVADAASDIADGALDARLEPSPDPELQRLTEAFNEMADAVQTRIEREERFASDVSHELRSPITAMTAAVEMLASRRDELSPRAQQALDLLVDQVRRFDNMVIDLLELSRLEAGAIDGHIEMIDIVDWIRRIVHRSSTPGVHIEVEPKFNAIIATDRVRIDRIVANLIENAQVHAGGARRIAISADGDHIAIIVDDNGPGVEPADRKRIFERFARGGAARHRVGTGLGLALVSEHAAALGGSAQVTDAPGGGARFIVRLPRLNSEQFEGVDS